MQTFKDRLKTLMKGDKPYTFARKCGIDKGLFQNYWQKGKIPTSETLLKLQRATGCSLDWLLTGRLPTLTGQVDKLPFKVSRKETGKRNMGLMKTARAIKLLYETADDGRIRALEALVDTLHPKYAKKGRPKKTGSR